MFHLFNIVNKYFSGGSIEKFSEGGQFVGLKEDDFVWNAIGKKLVVDKVTDTEYYLAGFGDAFGKPFSKSKVDAYIKSGEWKIKPRFFALWSDGMRTKKAQEIYVIGFWQGNQHGHIPTLETLEKFIAQVPNDETIVIYVDEDYVYHGNLVSDHTPLYTNGAKTVDAIVDQNENIIWNKFAGSNYNLNVADYQFAEGGSIGKRYFLNPYTESIELNRLIAEPNFSEELQGSLEEAIEKAKSMMAENQLIKKISVVRLGKSVSQNKKVADIYADKSVHEFAEGGELDDLLKSQTPKKLTRSQKNYNKEVDAYKWFIVDLAQKKVVSGWEFKEDAKEALNDYDGDKNFKIIAESALNKNGISNPKEMWKQMEQGGGFDDYKNQLGKVVVKFENPEYNYATSVSGSINEAEARQYFVGKIFNVASYPKENYQKVVDIEFYPKGTYAIGGVVGYYDIPETLITTSVNVKPAGAANRFELAADKLVRGGSLAQQRKVGKVMHEFKIGKLKTHGKKVTNRLQAIAIALSEAGLSKKEEGGIIANFQLPASDVIPLGEGGIPTYNTPLDHWALYYEKGGRIRKSKKQNHE